jgi:hypothetical protein
MTEETLSDKVVPFLSKDLARSYPSLFLFKDVKEFIKQVKGDIKDVEKQDSPAFKPLYDKLRKIIDKRAGKKLK